MVCSRGRGGHLLGYFLWEGQVPALPHPPPPRLLSFYFLAQLQATPIFLPLFLFSPHPVAPTVAPRPPSSSWWPVRNQAPGGPRCGSEDGPRCGKGRAPSFLHLPLPPSPAADPSPSARDRASAARTLATASQSRPIRGVPGGEAGQRRALSSVLERVPDSPRPCLPEAASAMRGAGGAC